MNYKFTKVLLLIISFSLGYLHEANAAAAPEYKTPEDYRKSDGLADKAVSNARSHTIEALKNLRNAIKEFQPIIEHDKATDAYVHSLEDENNTLKAEVKRLKANGGQRTAPAPAGQTSPDWMRKTLAHIASERGNGFKKLTPATVDKIVKDIEANIPNANQDNKWKPILNAARKASQQPNTAGDHRV